MKAYACFSTPLQMTARVGFGTIRTSHLSWRTFLDRLEMTERTKSFMQPIKRSLGSARDDILWTS